MQIKSVLTVICIILESNPILARSFMMLKIYYSISSCA